MELIQTVTVGSGGAASMVFGTGGTLPITYDDLYLVVSSRTSNTGTCALFISFNGSTSNFSSSALEGNGSSASSFTLARFIGGTNGSGTTSNTFTSVETYIPNYRSSVAKSYSANNANENNATEAFQTIIGGLWNDTAPITSLTVTPQLGNFVEGSSASLYGIRKFTGGTTPKATGGTVSQAGGYWIHTFTTSGDFIPSEALTNVEYLVIAGGGGGGTSGGGGGAGGYRCSVVGESSGANSSAEARLSLASGTRYNVMVGAGGAGGNSAPRGGSGTSSTFAGISSTGGGGGGGGISAGVNTFVSGLSGGSGGAGTEWFGAGSGGAGTANQGLAGGNGASGSGGGGGGATAAGANGTGTPGNGGNGLSSSITGTAVTRAGGGGGANNNASSSFGSGGSGGGGNGGAFIGGVWTVGAAGTVSTGGGGGGGGNGSFGAQGGSGIVIVRYAV